MCGKPVETERRVAWSAAAAASWPSRGSDSATRAARAALTRAGAPRAGQKRRSGPADLARGARRFRRDPSVPGLFEKEPPKLERAARALRRARAPRTRPCRAASARPAHCTPLRFWSTSNSTSIRPSSSLSLSFAVLASEHVTVLRTSSRSFAERRRAIRPSARTRASMGNEIFMVVRDHRHWASSLDVARRRAWFSDGRSRATLDRRRPGGCGPLRWLEESPDTIGQGCWGNPRR